MFWDSDGERDFASDLETAPEVQVFAKLPRSFQIPTPVGNYAPDWAIAFEEGSVRHVFFVAETKGSMSTLDLRPIEKAKIRCARKVLPCVGQNSGYGWGCAMTCISFVRQPHFPICVEMHQLSYPRWHSRIELEVSWESLKIRSLPVDIPSSTGASPLFWSV